MEAGEEGEKGGIASREKIFVSVRVRPLNEKEILSNDVSDWECVNDSSIVYKNANVSVSERSMYPSSYSFDRVFGDDCSTRQVYEQGAKEVALAVVDGINSSVFAYGQTSSGKTYTMIGITGYTTEDIYEYIEKHNEREFVVKFSAMEIYNELVKDLLSEDATPLRLLDDPERGPVVEKLTEETVRNKNHLIELLSICEVQRQVGETVLNENSSRSHQIIRLTIESCPRAFVGRDNYSALSATLNFVDLAGSERASQSLTAGTRLKEGCHINRSLLTLGTVIRKLSKGRGGHIPYRDSKLTRILQPSLGGNARTAIICTMSPARTHVEQSRNTLLFASCAKEVSTIARVNVVMSDKALVKHLQRELARFECQVKNPLSTSETGGLLELVQDKNLHIEKLENQVKELTLQRDIAQSQLQQFLQNFGDSQADSDSVFQVDSGQYPSLRVRISPDSGNGIREGKGSEDIYVRSCSSGHSRSSSDYHVIRMQNFEENILDDSTPQRPRISNSNYSDGYSIQGWDESERQSNEASEDLWKEVHCIAREDPGSKELVASNYSSPETGFPAIRVIGNEEDDDEEEEDEEEEEEENINLGVVERDIKPESPSKDAEKDFDSVSEMESQYVPSVLFGESTMAEEENELNRVHLEDVSSNATYFSGEDSKNHQNESGSMTSTKTGSFKESPNPSFTPNEEVIKDVESKPKLTEASEDEERQVSPSNFSPDVEMTLSEKECHPSTNSTVDRNYAPDEEGKKNDEKMCDAVKKFKDVGLDPIEDEYKTLQSWPSEFRRLQKEIIELWHSCHVSLAHRTYFFLLFQGDSSDAIYMAVELRRLTYLKDTFDRKEKTIVRGETMSLEISKKMLHDERRMLSNQMLKKFTNEERDMLFLKWGIGLNTKLRRLQLARRLWTGTEDADHINDSAYLVAQLLGFIDTDLAQKEMFTLDFAPRFTRSYNFKRSFFSIL